MALESHNIYENIRTRTIVLRNNTVLIHPPLEHEYWRLPGGGLEPGESLAAGRAPHGIITVRGQIESPWAMPDTDPWA